MEHPSRPDSSSLSAYLRVLRRRMWVVVLCAVLVPAAALVFSFRQPAQYSASADVLLSRQNLTVDSNLFVYDNRLAGTQIELAHTPDVAQAALRSARVPMSPHALLGQTSVASKGDTDILEFTVTDGEPERAQLLANAFAQAYIDYRGTLETKTLVKARSELADTLARLKAEGRENSDLYASLEEKEQQLATSQTLQTSQAYLTRRADSAAKIAPTPRRNAVLGLMLGLVLGLGLAFGIDALDTRVRSAKEIGERLDLPLLARIAPPPKGFARKNRLAMLAQPTGTSAEAFRMLRTNLDFATLEHDNTRVIADHECGRARGQVDDRREPGAGRGSGRAQGRASSTSTFVDRISTASSGCSMRRASATSRWETSSSTRL